MRLAQILAKLTPITGRDLRKVMTRERLTAMQDAILALADGENITTSGGLRKGLGGGRLRLDMGYVKPGKGGGAAAGIPDPWQPRFFTEGTPESPIYKCRFNLGTINNVPATNWNDAFTLTMAEDEYYFAVVTVASSSGQVTGLTLSVESTAPATDDIAKGTPPTSHQIVLGALGRTTAKMIETTNLNVAATVVFLESKAAPAEGAEPYDRWWRWNHTTV